jgi:hypothetical protein
MTLLGRIVVVIVQAVIRFFLPAGKPVGIAFQKNDFHRDRVFDAGGEFGHQG